jgi:hypothetical protein
MNLRKGTTLISGVVIAALLLMGAGFPTKGVPPKGWATDVCTAVNDWVNATKAGAADLDAQLSGTNPDLRDVRDALAGYMGETAHATTLAIDDMDAAGIPATPKGAKASATLEDSFRKIRASLRKLQNQAEDISIKHKKKALKQINALNKQVDKEFASFRTALGRLPKLDPDHQLKRAFQADAECQAL